jgi:4-amino-4-deoxy-L-arabinose transferase-like glycosyltransferase
MHTAYRIVLACAWLLPGASMAQAAANAADPRASVPAATYRPLITYRPEAAPETPPDSNWAANNATVAAYDAMALTRKMKGMQAHGAAAPVPADPHARHAEHAAGPARPAATSAQPAPDHKASP